MSAARSKTGWIGAFAVLVTVCAVAGCEIVRDVQLTPADGAVTYARELCQQSPADRAALRAAMDNATRPNVLVVHCDGE